MGRLKETKRYYFEGYDLAKSKYADIAKWIIKIKDGTTHDDYTPK